MKLILLLTLLAHLQIDPTWCPVLDHPHKKHFRYGQWMKKQGLWQRPRICNKKSCPNYKIKQYQYAY
jgi:hypothetical protein